MPLLIFFGVLVIYVLSIGPVIKISDVKTTHKLPKWAERVYSPLLNLKTPWMIYVLDWYICLWLAEDYDSYPPEKHNESK